MIKNLLNPLHPGFDALSSFADLNDVDRASSRISRHMANCPACRAVVDDVRALGERARVERAEPVPHHLWTRIERASTDKADSARRATPEPGADLWDGAPSLRPTSSWSRANVTSSRGGLAVVAVALAAGLVALLAWPGRPALEAAGPAHLTFTPARPVPGRNVHVRYRPAPWLRGEPRLVLVGRMFGDTTLSPGSPVGGDSIATLRPTSAGIYEGDFALGAAARGVWLGVSDSVASETDADGWGPWVAIAGTADGKPSLAALLEAEENQPRFYGPDAVTASRQPVDVADSLRRYFPKFPAGWAYSRPKQGKGSWTDRLIGFFQSSERKYMAFYEELWPQKKLDAERLHEMVRFAQAIDEPDEVNRWARRLALEHPEDPRALPDLAEALHALELKEPPGLRDSIRPWIPVFERLAPARSAPDFRYDFLQLVSRYGDSAVVARWVARFDSTAPGFFWRHDWEHDPLRRQRVEAVLLKRVQSPCVRPAGKFPIHIYGGDWLSGCQRDRSYTFTSLARAKLLDGEPLAALAFADSAEHFPVNMAPCGQAYGSGIVAVQASLRLGDTARAVRAVIGLAAWSNGRITDSLSSWFGARARSAQFTTAVDSAKRAFAVCAEREKVARETWNRRYKSAE